MSYRFDNRSKDQFKKDIYFATHLEKYFFNKWLDIVKGSDFINVTSWGDNGCGNDGEFIEKGNTSGADYKISGELTMRSGNKKPVTDMPLELKWVPTAGKFTLKKGDLKAYVRESANILFIYNSVRCGTDLRKPKDGDLEKHIGRIEEVNSQIRWGIMLSEKVKEFYDFHEQNDGFRPINYMGGKPGVVLRQSQFSDWFTERSWG